MCRLCAPWWIICAPVIIALSPNQQERLEVLQNNAMRTMLGAPRWSSACVMQSETRLVPLATRVQCIMACRVARVFRRDVEGVAQRRLRLGPDAGHRVPARQHVAHQHLASHPQPHSRGDHRAVAGGRCSPPPPTMLRPRGGPPPQSSPPRSCLPVKPCAPPGSCGSTR
ncbi:hypothetical protein GWK47_010372 [Chionoecetes opilio]|uniref:Secreted protein n=1 Tax=Chionoecetes opilio TaxID=41210 RepID=A0A8J5CQF1_CHIOP|nr:hypothetical protein GWK47_010372 [Chionoecetes opilio]